MSQNFRILWTGRPENGQRAGSGPSADPVTAPANRLPLELVEKIIDYVEPGCQAYRKCDEPEYLKGRWEKHYECSKHRQKYLWLLIVNWHFFVAAVRKIWCHFTHRTTTLLPTAPKPRLHLLHYSPSLVQTSKLTPLLCSGFGYPPVPAWPIQAGSFALRLASTFCCPLYRVWRPFVVSRYNMT